MKNIVKLLYILLFVLLLFGCEDFFTSEVDPPNIAKERQLVVHCYLSPTVSENDDIDVSVNLSNPTFGKQNVGDVFEKVEDAIVTISDERNKKTITLPYDKNTEKYHVSVVGFVEEGGEYGLEVRTPDGKKATANCNIPKNIKGDIENIRMVREKRDGDYRYRVAFDFTDYPDVKNYYIAEAGVLVADNYNQGAYREIKFYFEAFDDYNHDGELISVKSKDYRTGIYVSDSDMINGERIKNITVRLFTIDKHYYDYQRTAFMQNDFGDAGPFMEPTIIISNVSNGLGLFGGYVKSEKTQKFK